MVELVVTSRVTDAGVIRRSWEDPEAFAELFDRHADDIHRYAAWRLGADAADDLLAETFAQAFQHRRRYDVARSDARPWLYGIATNLVARHRRSEARRLRALAREAPPAGAEPMADRVAARLSARAACGEVAEALAAMPAKQRDVVLLVAWAELEYEEVAHALGVPLGTVRSRLSRARKKLRRAVTEADHG
jgi:RNA polymerase sigma-70 factor (ECF subfamily)